MKKLLCVCSLAAATSFPPLAWSQTPGVPEPGIFLFGKVLAADGVTPIPATLVRLQLTGSGTAIDAERATGANGEPFYLARIRFESILESLTDSVSVPNLDGVEKAYGLNSSFGNLNRVEYDRNENNVIDPDEVDRSITAVDSAVSRSSFSFGGGGARGGIFRMDLKTNFDLSGIPDYDTWAAGYFGSSEGDGAPGEDPDGDGLTNEEERIAGLDPTNSDPDSPLNRFVVQLTPIQDGSGAMQIVFRPKVEGRRYELLRRSTLGSASGWTGLGAEAAVRDEGIPGFPGLFQGKAVDETAEEDQGFYSVRISLEP